MCAARTSPPTTADAEFADAYEAVTNIALTGRLLTALENWRQINLGSIANSGNGGDLSDTDRDGIDNLLEFRLRPEHDAPQRRPAPAPAKGGRELRGHLHPAPPA